MSIGKERDSAQNYNVKYWYTTAKFGLWIHLLFIIWINFIFHCCWVHKYCKLIKLYENVFDSWILFVTDWRKHLWIWDTVETGVQTPVEVLRRASRLFQTGPGDSSLYRQFVRPWLQIPLQVSAKKAYTQKSKRTTSTFIGVLITCPSGCLQAIQNNCPHDKRPLKTQLRGVLNQFSRCLFIKQKANQQHAPLCH